MSERTASNEDLDAILALQLTIAWAGEGETDPKRLGWWRTALCDDIAGAYLLKRLAPRTHEWAIFESVRRAAVLADRAARASLADPDRVRTLFFFGFQLDEALEDRLAYLKRETQKPAEALEFPLSLGTKNFDSDALASALNNVGTPEHEVVPGGREVTGVDRDDPGSTRAIPSCSSRSVFRQVPDAIRPSPRMMPVRSMPMPVVEGQEATTPHTRLLRLPLVVDDSRAYWSHWTPEFSSTSPGERAVRAFEQRWFGSKSLERVKLLLANFAVRFDAYPNALAVLHQWRPTDATTRSLICHWHTQLADPTYRAFTGQFLSLRRMHPDRLVDRDIAARWVREEVGAAWAGATLLRMANGLLTASTEAGLCTKKAGSRTVLSPSVADYSLAYLCYLLRETRFEGTLLANPYVASVDLEGGLLEQRLSRLPGLGFSRMGDVFEFDWRYPSLRAWAEGELYRERS